MVVNCRLSRAWGDDWTHVSSGVRGKIWRPRVHHVMSGPWETRTPLLSTIHPLPTKAPAACFYLRFWYQVLTCVSVRLREAASSMRSWTLRYFCRSKLRSSWASWWSVKAVRAFLGFLSRTWGLSLLLEISLSPSSFTGGQKKKRNEWEVGNQRQWKKNTVRPCLTVLIRENLNLNRGIKSGKQIKIKSFKSSQLDIFLWPSFSLAQSDSFTPCC